jgi:hypothetical protein
MPDDIDEYMDTLDNPAEMQRAFIHGGRTYLEQQGYAQAPTEVDTTNPKDLVGVKKPQLDLVPTSLDLYAALAFEDGARKYGPFNWREKSVRARIYAGAARRHIGAWLDREEVADDSGIPHLAHAAASLAILIDALENGNLIDDRPAPGPAASIIKKWTKQ